MANNKKYPGESIEVCLSKSPLVSSPYSVLAPSKGWNRIFSLCSQLLLIDLLIDGAAQTVFFAYSNWEINYWVFLLILSYT